MKKGLTEDITFEYQRSQKFKVLMLSPQQRKTAKVKLELLGDR